MKDKKRGAFYGLTVGDALGAAVVKQAAICLTDLT